MARRRQKGRSIPLFPVVLSFLSFFGLGYYVIVMKHGSLEGFRLFKEEGAEAIQESRTAELLSRVEEKIQTMTEKPSTEKLNPVTNELGNHIEYPALMTELPTNVADYPIFNNLLDVVSQWNPDQPDPPAIFRETLMHFNYSNPTEREYAAKFRDAELPFKLYDIPEITAVTHLWDDEYLQQQFYGDPHSKHVEKSKNNHFMYWTGNRKKYGNGEWTPPTEFVDSMNFNSWLKIAKHADEEKLRNDTVHYYFMSNAPAGDTKRTFIARDLPLFSTRTENFFVTDVPANKGIQCRFGMRGIISESHYDTGRNMVAMLKGAKRYILNPPEACKKIGIITDQRHPSYRHSLIDWSDIAQATSFDFAHVNAIDTIVRTGEVLYIPSFWFHYIVSLQYSAQCNTRSGTPPNEEGKSLIEDCLGITFGDMSRYNGGRKKNKNNG